MPTLTSQAEALERLIQEQSNLIQMRQYILDRNRTAYSQGLLSEEEYNATLKDAWSRSWLIREVAEWLKREVYVVSKDTIITHLLNGCSVDEIHEIDNFAMATYEFEAGEDEKMTNGLHESVNYLKGKR